MHDMSQPIGRLGTAAERFGMRTPLELVHAQHSIQSASNSLLLTLLQYHDSGDGSAEPTSRTCVLSFNTSWLPNYRRHLQGQGKDKGICSQLESDNASSKLEEKNRVNSFIVVAIALYVRL